VVLALGDIDTPLRGPLVLIAMAGVPVLAAASWLPSLDIFARIIAACAAAIALNALVSETMLALGAWSPAIALVTVLLICAAGSALRLGPVRGVLHLAPLGPGQARVTESETRG
jgi:hypothetical protein